MTSTVPIVEHMQRRVLSTAGHARKTKFLEACYSGDLATALEMAIDDVEAVQDLEGVSLRMDRWVEIREDGAECVVCLAGAVMLNTMGVAWSPDPKVVPLSDAITPHDYADAAVGAMLVAINYLRAGLVADAVSYICCIEGLAKYPVLDYQNSLNTESAASRIRKDIERSLDDPDRWRELAKLSLYKELVTAMRKEIKLKDAK